MPRINKKNLQPVKFKKIAAITSSNTSEERKKKQSMYNRRSWRRASKSFLLSNPFCAYCAKQGIVKSAQVTDHIKPHKGNETAFWNEGNWQPLCYTCHNKKSASERHQDG